MNNTLDQYFCDFLKLIIMFFLWGIDGTAITPNE